MKKSQIQKMETQSLGKPKQVHSLILFAKPEGDSTTTGIPTQIIQNIFHNPNRTGPFELIMRSKTSWASPHNACCGTIVFSVSQYAAATKVFVSSSDFQW